MLARIVLVQMWVGVTAYALFAGADFGGGIWDLFAGGPEGGQGVRERIEHSIGPVWEANHVWLIFVLVVLWTAFSAVFSALLSTLYIPFTVAAFGIILRGSAFAFRKEVTTLTFRRFYGAGFALASLLTPFAFGTIAGGVASGRVPPTIAGGDVISSWLNPTSVVGGIIAVGTCAYLAAVYLIADSRRDGDAEMADYFRRRALLLGAGLGLFALAAAPVIHADAPALFDGLVGPGLPLLVASASLGVVSILLMLVRRARAVRVSAAFAVVAAIWAWGVAQYPALLPPSLTVDIAAAPDPVLIVLAVGLAVGALLVLPSLALLYGLFQRRPEGA